ncbi:MAG: hypothetical protein CUN56_12465 [Phototrophicales bacterium]|nr:MAG: hypothetical protein CUN56_12465 [Phototrophicales bacterium]RMG71463.1 MAG: hypothetical protein D6711_15330 [Chloroflexota bacterium]
MIYSDKEQAYFDLIRQHITELKQFLSENPVPTEDDPLVWFTYIAHIRSIQGNSSNDQSFLATFLAKQYLMRRFNALNFDAAEKAQGAPGLDIDEVTQDGKRIIGEIKTTVPYGKHDLGSAQRDSFRKDFNKLNAADADYKFFFVTHQRTFEIVKQRYATEIPDVEVILLIDLG